MTKRYFYTCPVQAAYMMKHQGIQFLYWRDGQMLQRPVPLWAIARRIEHGDGTERYVVHPDSLALLEPQVVDKDDDGFIWDGAAWKQPQGMCDPRRNSRTSKRNGKAFMWPESEEV